MSPVWLSSMLVFASLLGNVHSGLELVEGVKGFTKSTTKWAKFFSLYLPVTMVLFHLFGLIIDVHEHPTGI